MNIDEFKAKHAVLDSLGQSDIERYLYQIDLEADHSDCEGETEFLRDLYSFLLELFPECDPYRKGIKNERIHTTPRPQHSE